MNKYDKKLILQNWLSLLGMVIIIVMIVSLVFMVATNEVDADCEEWDMRTGDCVMWYSNDRRP